MPIGLWGNVVLALQRTWIRIFAGTIAVSAVVAASLTVAPAPVAEATGPSITTVDFGFSNSTVQSFTVPAGITQLSLTATGGEGGLGGRDSQGEPIAGGYKGQVTGTLPVTPGQVLSISVGGGGTRGASSTSNQSHAPGGVSPLAGFAGGNGGAPGNQGSSGAGGGGGAATVISLDGMTIIAGGAGGGGGSGQWEPLVGRQAEASHSPRTDAVSGVGQNGFDVMSLSCSKCDGGGSGAGGGGLHGGKQGAVEFGTGTYTEWLGYGGFPGENSTGGIGSLSASYVFFPGNSGNGSVQLSYATGSPDAPTAVLGTAGNASVDLSWTAPTNTGGATIDDYIIQYAVSGPSPSWSTYADGASTDTVATVTGLTNGVSYIFRVAAASSFGTGTYSASSDALTPSDVPGAPEITAITPQDARLSVAFTPASSGAAIVRYEVRLDDGDWVPATGTASPIVVSGLTNGTAYKVRLRAVSAIGTGAASEPLSATPIATPGAPVIESITPGVGSASIEFTAGFDGGAAISGYQYRVGSGAWMDAGASSPIEVAGLADGATVSIQLRAVNSSGAGQPSAAVVVVTPDVPAAPVISTVTRGDRSLTLEFAPGADNGAAVTDYQVRVGLGAWVSAGTVSSPVTVTGLDNGVLTEVHLRAANAVGAGASSSATGTPATTPGAPDIVGNTISGTDATLDAYFTAPADDGGSAILRYQYSTDGGATWRDRSAGTTGSPLVITALSGDGTTALENGTEYFVEVRAVNGVGAGTASGVASGIPRSEPAAPAIDSVVAGDGTLAVGFTPGSNGGSAVLRYEYRLDSGSWTNTGSLGGAFIITGLTNGNAYDLQVRAVNGEGDGAASTTVTATPRSLAGVPVIGMVTPTDATLSLAVSLADDGGSAVTGWQYSTDGGATWRAASGAASPVVITALSSDGTTPIVNGVSYPTAVRAVTDAGVGSSSAVRLLSPRAVPAEPVITVSAQDGALSVAFSVADDGGSPITGIEYSLDGATYTSTGTLSSPFVIGGLVNGTSYAVEVRAVNVAGPSAESTSRTGTPRAAPAAPTAVIAESGDARTTVSWAAPVDNGGSLITGYVATAWATAGSTTPIATCLTSGAVACTITGLTNTSTYYVSVLASNAAGSGPASAPRVAVIPLAKPGAPTISAITPANTFLTVAFTAGAAGSRAITGYEYRLNGSSWVAAVGTASPLTISGLTNGSAYGVELRAISAAGAGAVSNTVTATPLTLPDAPDSATIVAEPSSGQATITWAAPNANGSAITSYAVVAWSAASQGSQLFNCSPSPVSVTSCTITGLTNGTTYYVSIDATNGVGTSTRSTPRVPVVFTGQPGMPTGVAGVSGDGSVALTWSAGTTGSSPITDYTIWYQAAGAAGYTQFANGVSATRSATVTGLTNGIAYTFQVRAVNGQGTSNPSAPSAAVTPIGPGTVPLLGTPVRTADGFEFEIVNHSSETTYGLSATHGATASLTGSTVTVAGLAAGESSTLTLTAQRVGYTTTSASVTGSALAAGNAPILSAPTSLPSSFTVTIENFQALSGYTLALPHGPSGATAVLDGDVATVSGLADGESVELVVTATRTGYTDATASVTGTSIPSAGAATLATPVRTADGATVAVTLPAGVTTTYAVDNGALAAFDGATFTITGLAPGASATLTVTNSRLGHVDAVSTVVVAALASGAAPTLSGVTATADGFTFTITNLDGSTSYTLGTTAGSVARSGSLVSVSGLAPAEAATVTVTAVLAGSTDASSSILASALATGFIDVSGGVTAMLDGFSFEIVNYSVAASYTLTTTAGTVMVAGSAVTVTGLLEGESATVTIDAVKPDATDASVDVTGTALITGTAPSLSGASPISGGFYFTITDFDPAAGYGFVAVGGGSVTRSGDVVTVGGLAPAASSEVRVTVSRTGHTDASATVTGTAAPPPPVVPPAPPPAPPSAPSAAPSGPDRSSGVPAAGRAMVGGSEVDASVSSTAGGTTISAAGVTFTLSGPGGFGKVAGTIVTARQGEELEVAVTGFQPGSPAEMWAHSTPTLLTTVTIGGDSTAQSAVRLPKTIPLGEHVLVVKGLDVHGNAVALSLGFLVVDDAASAPGTDPAKDLQVLPEPSKIGIDFGAVAGWLLLAVIVAMAVLFWLLAKRRRRDREAARSRLTQG